MPSNPVVKCVATGNKVSCLRNGFPGNVQLIAIIQTATGNQKVTTLVGAPPSNVVKNTQAERPT
jgi:hypothetical protein